MERVPMPVLHHICASGQMRVHDLAQLSWILRVLSARLPDDSLRIRLSHENIRMLQRATQIIRKPYSAAIYPSLGLEIWILGNTVERSRDCPLVEVGVHAAAEILCDELVGPL